MMKIDLERVLHTWLGQNAMIKFTTKGIEVYNGRLIIPVPYGTSIDTLLKASKEGKEVRVEFDLSKSKKPRSLSSNSYCWLLCQKIAEEMSKNGPLIKKEEVYRRSIKELFSPTFVPVPNDDVKEITEAWTSRGIGWMAEELGESTLYGHTRMAFYVGSSQFDTKKMSRLVDSLVQDARNLGIETISDIEQEELIAYWERDRKHNE